jgi:hypothetical protein
LPNLPTFQASNSRSFGQPQKRLSHTGASRYKVRFFSHILAQKGVSVTMKNFLMIAGLIASMTGHGMTDETNRAREVNVGIYLLSLGRLDVSTGSFSADFYLSLKSADPIPDNSFEFLNGRAGSIEKIEDNNGGREKFYRILANLTTSVDLKRFPFDSQKLQILIEDKTSTHSEFRFVPNTAESGMDSAIVFPGWQIHGWNITTAEHDYPVYDEKFSQLVYTVSIGRIHLNSFLKTFLPVLFLMLIVMSSFILNPDQITTRLAAISSALVASAMFHISISNQIPPVGYLTFADKFMVMTYFILLACFFMSLYVFILQGKKDAERARRVHRLTEVLTFFGMPLLYLVLFTFVK